ncbi:hypothetical protein BDDG_02767 [Blastomyces dermatitidis ATCC 18188]|uniref:Uncharacterized protein n=1 Tax=Ajellomyces dermatitidis (strain ATCC 18188 / CBS 674.68) TaxID=653446 RepID=F2T9B3_AJEDA|nr:hypothetical protein BDDG_02767 [Blastomyces dermatitidis ATCC 18188]
MIGADHNNTSAQSIGLRDFSTIPPQWLRSRPATYKPDTKDFYQATLSYSTWISWSSLVSQSSQGYHVMGEARMCRLCHKYCQECQSVYAFKAISVMGEKEIYIVSTFSDENLKMSELHPFGVQLVREILVIISWLAGFRSVEEGRGRKWHHVRGTSEVIRTSLSEQMDASISQGNSYLYRMLPESHKASVPRHLFQRGVL